MRHRRLLADRRSLLVHLLAPNQRPVQMTTDLSGFWDRLYPQVRRERSTALPTASMAGGPRPRLECILVLLLKRIVSCESSNNRLGLARIRHGRKCHGDCLRFLSCALRLLSGQIGAFNAR